MNRKKLIGAIGGFVTLLGLFLPFCFNCSLFDALARSQPPVFPPAAVLLAALAAILYALGLDILPFALSAALMTFVLCTIGALIAEYGLRPTLKGMQAGAWLTLAGPAAMLLAPLCPGSLLTKSPVR